MGENMARTMRTGVQLHRVHRHARERARERRTVIGVDNLASIAGPVRNTRGLRRRVAESDNAFIASWVSKQTIKNGLPFRCLPTVSLVAERINGRNDSPVRVCYVSGIKKARRCHRALTAPGRCRLTTMGKHCKFTTSFAHRQIIYELSLEISSCAIDKSLLYSSLGSSRFATSINLATRVLSFRRERSD